MDGAASRIVVSRSKTDHPAQVYLADAAGKRIAWLAENDIDAGHPYAPYIAALRPTVFGTIKADDGTVLHYKMITRSEEHTSELQSLMRISYAVFCLKKKKINSNTHNTLCTATRKQ